MSSISFLFSGADPTARDEVAPRQPVRQRSPGMTGNVARTARRVTLRMATTFALATSAFAFTPAVQAATAIHLEDRTLDAIRTVQSSREPPTAESRDLAADLVTILRNTGVEPDRVLADSDGGVALYVFGNGRRPDGSHSRYARILAPNAGGIVVLLADREHQGAARAFEAPAAPNRERATAIRRVLEFVGP